VASERAAADGDGRGNVENGRSPRTARFGFDRSFEFELPPDQLWTLLSDTSAFPRWWPWLRSFEAVPLEPGATTRCSIGPPLPYLINVDLAVDDVVTEKLLAVSVSGDLHGPARLEIAASALGSTARLVWELTVTRPGLRVAARVARPLLLWGHDWVVNSGVEQFRRATIDQHPG
jgi:uncharacterized protein YndB with AHSA1/START domain